MLAWRDRDCLQLRQRVLFCRIHQMEVVGVRILSHLGPVVRVGVLIDGLSVQL